MYFIGSVGLSLAWRQLDRPEKALEALQSASRERQRTHPFGKEAWMMVQLELARFYREHGRDQDADAIEVELRQLMAVAEPDFWLVRELDADRKAVDSLAMLPPSSPSN